MTQSPRLETILEDVADSATAKLWTALPARVETFDSSLGTVDAYPVLWQLSEEEDGSLTTARMPIVPSCPVFFPGGKDGRSMCPVQKGDLGLLIFTSGAMDEFLATGTDARPTDLRRNTLSDAIFLHGIHHLSGGDYGPPENYSDDAVVVAAQNGKTIRLGRATAAQAVVLGTDFAAAMDAFFTAFSAWGDAVGTATGVSFTPVANAIFSVASQLSEKVFVE
mgnify:FL=1